MPIAFEVDVEHKGLKVELYDADPAAAGRAAPTPVASATPLPQGTIDELLVRVGPLEGAEGDRQAFAMRPGSKPPPLPGSDVTEPFPPQVRPPVAEVPSGPVRVLRTMPEGEVPMAPHVSITFDRPMVAVTSQAEAAKTVPAKLIPEPAGSWRWLGTRTLLFDPEPRLPMATSYTVEVPAGTSSATGDKLAEAVRFTFATPPVTLLQSLPTDGPQRLDPVMVLSFDQAVDAAAILPFVELAGGPTPVKLRVASEAEIARDDAAKATVASSGPGRSVALVATEPLPRDTHFTLKLRAGAPSAEGPRTTTADQWGGFYTYAPLAIVEHHCSWQDQCPPTAPWMIRFDNPLEPAKFDPEAVTVEPAVPGLSAQVYGDTIHLSGAFVGRTTYTVTVPATVTDTFGQTLGAAQNVVFRVGPAEKTLEAPGDTFVTLDPAGGAKLPIWSTNHATLKVTVHAVAPSDYPAWSKWLESFWYEDSRPKRLPGTVVFQGTVTPAADRDRKVETAIDFAPWLKDGGQFVVLVEPTVQPRDRWNRQYVYKWVQVTDVGLTAFVDRTQLVGWATDLKTGDPAPGVSLELLSGGAKVDTGPDGLALLGLPAPEAQVSNLLIARRGTDLAILPESTRPWHGSSWVKRSDLDQLRWYVADDRGLYRPGEQARVKGWLRRWEQGPSGDIASLTAKGGQIRWTLTGSMGNELGKGQVPISGLGGFQIDVPIPAESNLGVANLYLEAVDVGALEGLTTSHPIRIEEFRRPEFEVTAAADADHHTLGERGRVDLTAAYYAGGGLPNAELSWTIYAQPASYAPPGWAGWSFGTWTPWWMGWDTPYEQPVGSFSSKTDGSGAHHLGMHFRSLNPPRPMSVRAEGTVFDVNRQAWTASSTMLLHPSSVYVGLKTARSFVEKGKPIDVELVIVDVDGKPVVTTAELTLARMEWGRGADGAYGEQAIDPQTCSATADAKGLTRCSFATIRGGSYRMVASVRDPEGRPNESELRVWVSGAEVAPARDVSMETVTLVPEAKDLAAGQTARILVQAPFFPAEGVLTLRRSGLVSTERFRMDGPTKTLEIPIRDEYVPDVTVQVNLAGAAPRVDDDGKVQADLPKRVAHAVGSITFQVPPIARTLTVRATPAAAALAPGAATTIALEVTGADGKPVAGAELAVIVADESVLALTGYQLPDPLEVFYAARGPGVADHHLRSSIALANPAALPASGPSGAIDALGYDGNGRGGGGNFAGGLAQAEPMMDVSSTVTTGAPMQALAKNNRGEKPSETRRRSGEADGSSPDPNAAIAMRTDFSALALFAPDVRTDAAGRATVPLTLPDSLTRYRIMVVAVDAGHAFGSADAAITARLPLMVRPSAPRFLNFGDQMELPVVLQNQTDAAMKVNVAVRATNVRFVDTIGPSLPDLPDLAVSTAGKQVTVPANDRVEVRFPAATLMAGTARFQVVGAAGAVSDAATLSLPVWTPATTEAFATYGEIDAGVTGIVQPVQAPPGAWPQFGGLEVTAASTQLQALTDAVLYLQSYPFECNEQLASRVLGIASLRDVLSAFDAEGLPPAAELEAQVDADLERLASRQHYNGGFAFWRRGDEPWPFLSIHVANAFARAKAKGYTVPPEAWSRSQSHLVNIESYIPGTYSQEAKWFLRAYALDVLRRMGTADPRKARALYKEAGTGLGIDGLAFLLPTLHEGGATTEVAAILRQFGNNTTESAGTAHFVTSYSDGAQVLLHSDRRADGIVLEALIETKPDADLVAKVVRGLLAHKTKGRWGNTQENAFVLLALDRYFRVYEKETPDFVAQIWLGDGYLGDHAFVGRTTERAHFEVPMGFLTESRDAQPLTVVRDGKAGRLYYRIGLRYAPKDLRLLPADYGFAVARRYEPIDDPADVRHDPDGTWHIAAGARVRVHLSMATEMRRYHVALVDPLPAGLEAQNPVLATTGTLPPGNADQRPKYWWWSRSWWEHENLRDERVEAFTSLLWEGVHEYEYVARATTPGRYVVPPTRAEEMYMPETFGRAGTDIVIVE